MVRFRVQDFSLAAVRLCIATLCLAGCDGSGELLGLQFLERSDTYLPQDEPLRGRTAELGDLTGDGVPELIVGYDGSVAVWRRLASGRFDVATNVRLPAPPSGADEIRLVDVEADGDLDVLLSSAEQGVRVWVNQGTGTFTDRTTLLLPPGITARSAAALEVVDLDEDGLPALFLSGSFGTTLLLNRGNGLFREPSPASLPLQLQRQAELRTALFADLDDDERLELLVEADGRLELLELLEDGRFQFELGRGPLEAFGRIRRLATLDLEGDGDPDLVTVLDAAEPGASGVILLRNEGAGRFRDASLTLLPPGRGHALDVTVADLDLDGDPDLLLPGLAEAGLRIYLNDGTGRFVDRTAVLLGDLGPVERTRVADFDGDGDPDVLALRREGGTAMLLNQLDAPLEPTPTPDPNETPDPDETPTPDPTETPTR